jgi:ubiquinol-cytochrome c reductase cytochrome c subunit
VRLLNRTARRVSRHRRSRLAGFVLMLFALLATGTVYSALSPAQAGPATSDAELVAKGRDLFLVGCSYCHGQNGEGQRDQRGQNFGPPLVGVGAAAVDFQVGTGRMPMTQPGQQAPQKEVAYSEEEVEALAAYVASLGVGPGIPTSEQYSLEGMTDEEKQEAIVRGGQIFLANCTACHNFEGSGGAMPRGGHAPKIRGVEPRYIYEAMLTGPQQMPTFSNGTMTPEAKRDVIAYLTAIDENPGYGGFGLGGYGPVAEGMFAWLGGIGVLVGFAVWIAAHTTRTTRKTKAAAGEEQA